MNDHAVESTFDLAKRVHDMMAQYVHHRAEVRSGVTWDQVRGKQPPDPLLAKYREAEAKACMDAFLSMRSCRTAGDFVSYFTGTICAVPQFLPMKEYQSLAEVLLGRGDDWEKVKSLSMLALAGLSRG